MKIMNLIPESLVQGNSFTINYIPTDITINDSNGWSLNLALRGVTDSDFISTYDPQSKSYSIVITTVLANYEPGIYTYFLYLSNTDQRLTVENGSVTITGDPLTTIGQDLRSHNVKILASIEAFIERRATNNQIDFLKSVLDGKELERMSFTDLQKLRQVYLRAVKLEKGTFPKGVAFGFRRLY
jgi:hypothetical protein